MDMEQSHSHNHSHSHSHEHERNHSHEHHHVEGPKAFVAPAISFVMLIAGVLMNYFDFIPLPAAVGCSSPGIS